MPAANTDTFIKAARKLAGNVDSSGIPSAIVDNFGLTSAAGLPTDTAVVITIDRVDSNGNKTPDKEETVRGVVSGNSLVSVVRGVEGTAQAHSAGAVWECRLTAHQWNRLIDAMLAGHNQDGTLKDISISTPVHAATSKTTPVDADEIPVVDSASSNILKKLTWANLKATLKTYFDTLYPPKSGWISYSTVTPTRASADDPTYVLTFAGVDLTSTISVGMKVKFTQNSTVRYGIVTAISFSTDTTLTLYGGTDYDVDDTATYAISAFNYSTEKAPVGFPLDPSKWTVTTTDTSDRQQTSPVQNTWYNLGSINIVVPIGSWRTSYQCAPSPLYNTNTSANQYVTLSTANNSESDSDFTVFSYSGGASGNIRHDMPIFKEKFLSLASKTTYYLNSKTDNTSQTQLNLRNSIQKTIIRAVCAYL